MKPFRVYHPGDVSSCVFHILRRSRYQTFEPLPIGVFTYKDTQTSLIYCCPLARCCIEFFLGFIPSQSGSHLLSLRHNISHKSIIRPQHCTKMNHRARNKTFHQGFSPFDKKYIRFDASFGVFSSIGLTGKNRTT